MKGTEVKRTKILATASACVALVALAACSSSKPAESSSSSSAGVSSPSSASSASASSAVSSAPAAASGGAVASSGGAAASSGGAATSGSASASGSAESNAPTKANKNYNISFVQGVAGDNFYITMQCGIQAEAKKLGVTVNTQGPAKFDATLQKPIVDSVVASKPDGILIAPTDTKAMQSPLNNAVAAGIKIGLVDTTLADPSKAVTAVASDNLGGGAAAFTALKGLSPNGGKVLVLSVKPGISTTDLRQQGFEQAVKADPKFDYVGVQFDQDDPTIAAQLTTAALQKDPDLVGIFATNLFSAEGAATGLKQAGKTSQVKIVGFDAGPTQIKDLQAGTVQALVAQQPYQIGVDGLDQLVNALNGTPATAKIQTGFTVVTKANIESSGAAYKAAC
jgi:ribose transport system substrate-binding protein